MSMSLLNETIQTERLVQKAINMIYKEEIYNTFTENVTKYMYPQPTGNIEDIASFIESSIKGLEEGSNLQLVILSRDGEFLGCSGLHKANTKTPELGIWLKEDAHGHGYGKEAIGGIIKWARQHVDFDHILYPVDKDNVSSRRIPEAYGGVIAKSYQEENSTGGILNILEYWIK
jgi:RimJ/RimL family protein N-acetyltransferase